MGKIFENSYYIDVDGIIEKCKTGGMLQDEDGKEVIEINVFKYELIKMLIKKHTTTKKVNFKKWFLGDIFSKKL